MEGRGFYMLRSKKCKLALMGAHGVGKTIFFGSYFYQTTQLGRGCCSISVKKSQSMDAIAQIMKKLFQEHTVVTGTVERIDLSFEASPPLGLDVEFYDVPGGHTQDSKQWVEENILPDLQKAHGVLFFVSAEDALKHKDRILKDNIVFGEAISYIRKDREGKRWRQDVPIYFLFTKCDLIPPEVSLEELEAGIPALIKAAKESGKFVRSWKVTSLGKWIDPSSPPEEYNPENVLEPMESMLEEVKKSCSIWTRKKMVVAALAGLLAWGGLIGLARTFDQNRWDTARREIEQHIQMERFPKAIGVLDGFYERIKVPYLVLPEFLTPGPDAEEFRRGLYQKYEKYAYSALEPYLDVDLNAVPQGNPELFKEAAEMVRAYLENSSYFYGINPEHYEKVRAVEAYYEVGKLFLSVSGSFDPYQQPGEMFASAQALLQLEKETPPEWRENLHQRTETLIRDWVTTFSLTASPQDMEDFALQLEDIARYHGLSEELRSYLAQEKDALGKKKEAKWRDLYERWVYRASLMEPEDAIRSLQEHQVEEALPKEFREGLQKTLEFHRERFVSQKLKEADGKSPEDAIAILEELQKEEGFSEASLVEMRKALEIHQARLLEKLIQDANGRKAEEAIQILRRLQSSRSFPDNFTEKIEKSLEIHYARLVKGWISAVDSEPDPERAIAILQNRKTEMSLSRELVEKIESAITDQNNRIVSDEFLKRYDIEKLERLLVEYPSMSSKNKERIQARKYFLIEEGVSSVVAAIGSSKTFDDLKKHVPEIQRVKKQYPREFPGLSREFQETVQRLVNQEISMHEIRVEAFILGQEFEKTKVYIKKVFYELASEVRGFEGELEDVSFVLEKLQEKEAGFLEKVAKTEQKFYFKNIRSGVASVKKFEDLKKYVLEMRRAKKQYPREFSELSREFQETSQRLLDQEISRYKFQTQSFISSQDFGKAKQNVQSAFGELISEVGSFGGELEDSSLVLKKINEASLRLLQQIEESEYEFCNLRFNSIRFTQDKEEVERVLQRLREFLGRWPSSSRGGEIKKVLDFLMKIQGGTMVCLTVVSGDFSGANSWSDTPDMFVEVYRGDTLLTSTEPVEDEIHPNFDHSYDFTWDIDTELVFVGIEKDPMSANDEVFRCTVRATGLFGYTYLNNFLTSGGNKLAIRLGHSIPECPW